MAGDVRDFVVGGIAVAAGFGAALIPGVGGLLAGTLYAYGSARIITGIIGVESNRSALERRIEGAKIDAKTTQASIPVVYGVYRVGMRLVDLRLIDSTDPATPSANPGSIFSGADDNDILVKVGAFALGSVDGTGIQAIDDIRVYDDGINVIVNPVAFSSAPSSTGVISRYSSKLKYVLEDGDDSQTTQTVVEDSLGWGIDMKGAGVAYGAFFMFYDTDVWNQGEPRITAEVTGNRVYDPRTSAFIGFASSGASSDNPALCILDYLTSKRYGGGVPYAARDGGSDDFIDEQSFIDAANYCDDLVSIPPSGTEKRFRMNGAVDTSRKVGSNLADMLATCRGELVWQSGTYRLIINQVTTAETFELTEDNIVGSLNWVRKGTAIPNLIEGTYPDAQGGHFNANSVVWPLTGDTTFLDEDNGVENRIEIGLPFTTGYLQTLRTIMVWLREARNDVLVNLTAYQEAYKLQVGEVVKVTHEGPGWDQLEFRVRQVALTPNGLVNLSLQQYTAGAYTLDTLVAQPSSPTTNLPDPSSIVAPTGVVALANSTTALSTQDGLIVPRIKLSWGAVADPFLSHYEARFKKTADADFTLLPNTPKEEVFQFAWPVTDGVGYTAEVRAVNTVGVVSDWSTSTVTPTTTAGTVGGWDLGTDDLSSGNVKIDSTAERLLFGAATAPLTGIGIFLGLDVADYEFRAGDPANDFIHWDGSNLNITGTLTATTGVIGGWTIGVAELSAGSVKIQSTAERILFGEATAPLTGIGIFLGKDGADYEFRAGDPAGDFIHWDGGDLNITGTVTADAGIIGGWTIAAGELSAGSPGVKIQSTAERMLFGAASAPSVGIGVFLGLDGSDYEFRAGNPAGNRIHWDGTDLLLTGMILKAPAPGTALTLQGWAHDLEFTAVDNDTVQWTTGTVTMPSGDTFAIVAGNTGAIATVLYVFLDIGVSSTVLQTTATASAAVGSDRILVAVTRKVAVTSPPKKAEFIVYGGGDVIGLSKTILADVIGVNEITFNEMAGNTITAAEIDSLDLTTQSLTATVGAIGGWNLGSNTLSSLNISINSSTEQMLFGSAVSFLSGTGIFIGLDGGPHKFRVGDPLGTHFYWNGTAMSLEGSLRFFSGATLGLYNAADSLRGSLQAVSNDVIVVGSWSFTTGDVALASNKRLEFGGAGSDTYILETTVPNQLKVFAGGTESFRFEAGGPAMPSGSHFLPGGVASTYYDGTGGVKHSFVVSSTERLLINTSGASITGTLGVTGSITSGDSVWDDDDLILIGNSPRIFFNGRSGTAVGATIATGGSNDQQLVIRLNPNAVSAGIFVIREDATDLFSINISAGGIFADKLSVTDNLGVGQAASGSIRFAVTTTASTIAAFTNTHASNPAGILIDYSAAAPDGAGNLFINCIDSTAGASQMTVASDGDLLNQNGSYGTISDRSLKTNTTKARPQLPDIRKLAELAVNYELIKHEGEGPVFLGWVAQDVEPFMPGLVGEDHNGLKTFKSSIAFTKTVIAVGELDAEVSAVKDELSIVRAQNAELARRVAYLEIAA